MKIYDLVTKLIGWAIAGVAIGFVITCLLILILWAVRGLEFVWGQL